EIRLEMLGDVDDHEQDRKAESGDEKDPPELGEDVSVERPKDAPHAAAPARPRTRANQSLTASMRSDMPPPRAVVRSVPMRAMRTMATAAKIMLSAHIAQNGEMMFLFARSSPTVRAT